MMRLQKPFFRALILIFLPLSVVIVDADNICQDVIAFTASKDDDRNVYLVDMCSGEERQITDDGISWMPIWSPTGDAIALQRTVNFSDQIYVHEINQAEPGEVIVSGNIVNARYPAWSPDGEQISFSGESKVGQDFQLYLVRRNGSGLHQFVSSLGSVTYSAWSPDGTKIAFVSHQSESTHSISIVNSDGSDLIDVPVDAYLQDYLTWHPSSSQLAFISGYQIYFLSLEDLEIKRITTEGNNRTPSWSPDGMRILFSSFMNHHFQIYIINDDNTLTQLTLDGNNRSPIWSPDGKRIAFISDREGYWNVYVMDMDGRNLFRITNNNLSNTYPVWSPHL